MIIKSMHIPIKPEERELLVEASKLVKLKPTIFLRQSALLRAEKVIQDSKSKFTGDKNEQGD